MDNFKRFAGLVVLVMLGALVPISSSGAEPRGATSFITLKGDRTAYVDVVIDETITPQADHIQVSTSGTYAGYVITEHVGDLVMLAGGSFAVPPLEKKAMKQAGVGIGALGFAQRELEPGTYRFQLISDGRATVKIPVEGLSTSMTLRPSHNAVAHSALESMGSGPGDLEDRLSVRRSKTTITMMTLLELVDTHQGSAIQQCLKEGSENSDACDATKDYGATWTVASPGSVGPGWIYSFAGFYDGYAVGDHTAVQRVAQAAASSENFAFYLNFKLTAPGANNMPNPAPEETFSFPYQHGGVQGQTTGCAVYIGTFIGSCWGVGARPTDHQATVEVLDTTGAPSAATVAVGDETLEICGKTTEPLDIEPGSFVFVDVHAHPTAECPDGIGTTGTVEVTLSP